MYEMIYWGDVPLHWPLILLCAIGCMSLYAFCARKSLRADVSIRAALTHSMLSALLGLFLARAIYAAVCWYDIFLDEMGNFNGLGAFFDPTVGSMNVIGFLAGLLIAAPVAARLANTRTAALLDASAIPALAMYTLARAIEPLTGQGYGDFIEMPVDVCWLEAALTLLLIVCLPMIAKKCRKPGALFQYALTIWCLAQILPESLRCDEALFVLVFARVTHLGLAVTLGLILIRLLAANRKRLSAKGVTLDVIGLAAGLGLAIGAIFALDKTNWPKPLVYLMMLAAIAELGVLICRRIRWADHLET
nr:hypothetical protein [Clostridia bacterium]